MPVKNENMFTITYDSVVRFVRQIGRDRRSDNKPVVYRYTIVNKKKRQ